MYVYVHRRHLSLCIATQSISQSSPPPPPPPLPPPLLRVLAVLTNLKSPTIYRPSSRWNNTHTNVVGRKYDYQSIETVAEGNTHATEGTHNLRPSQKLNPLTLPLWTEKGLEEIRSDAGPVERGARGDREVWKARVTNPGKK